MRIQNTPSSANSTDSKDIVTLTSRRDALQISVAEAEAKQNFWYRMVLIAGFALLLVSRRVSNGGDPTHSGERIGT